MDLGLATAIGVMVLAGGEVTKLLVNLKRLGNGKESREITPQPLQVKVEDQPQTKKECKGLHEALTNALATMDLNHGQRTRELRAEIKEEMGNISSQLAGIDARFQERIQQVDEASEKRASNIHNRIDPIAQRLASVNDRLDDHLKDHREVRK
jgi:uncharacterized coiled-coil DUF342 family protein